MQLKMCWPFTCVSFSCVTVLNSSIHGLFYLLLGTVDWCLAPCVWWTPMGSWSLWPWPDHRGDPSDQNLACAWFSSPQEANRHHHEAEMAEDNLQVPALPVRVIAYLDARYALFHTQQRESHEIPHSQTHMLSHAKLPNIWLILTEQPLIWSRSKTTSWCMPQRGMVSAPQSTKPVASWQP